MRPWEAPVLSRLLLAQLAEKLRLEAIRAHCPVTRAVIVDYFAQAAGAEPLTSQELALELNVADYVVRNRRMQVRRLLVRWAEE